MQCIHSIFISVCASDRMLFKSHQLWLVTRPFYKDEARRNSQQSDHFPKSKPEVKDDQTRGQRESKNFKSWF